MIGVVYKAHVSSWSCLWFSRVLVSVHHGDLCFASSVFMILQSTLIISDSKEGLFEILRDIRTSTYQVCRIEDK